MLELGANTDYPIDYQTTSPNQVSANQVSAITASPCIVNGGNLFGGNYVFTAAMGGAILKKKKIE